jgi:hypothetical protein
VPLEGIDGSYCRLLRRPDECGLVHQRDGGAEVIIVSSVGCR